MSSYISYRIYFDSYLMEYGWEVAFHFESCLSIYQTYPYQCSNPSIQFFYPSLHPLLITLSFILFTPYSILSIVHPGTTINYSSIHHYKANAYYLLFNHPYSHCLIIFWFWPINLRQGLLLVIQPSLYYLLVGHLFFLLLQLTSVFLSIYFFSLSSIHPFILPVIHDNSQYISSIHSTFKLSILILDQKS